MGGKRWTKDEVELLLELGEECKPSEISKLLPGRGPGAISKKRRGLGIVNKPAPRPWTKKEDNLIRKLGATITDRNLFEYFPDRTPHTVTKRRIMLGVSKDLNSYVRSPSIRPPRNYKLDQSMTLDSLPNDEYQILMGSFLGDGGINVRTSTSFNHSTTTYNFVECHGVAQTDYVKWKANWLPSLSPNFSDSGIKPFYATPHHNMFREIRKYSYIRKSGKFFRKNKLKKEWIDRLDLFGLLIWYLDDGNLSFKNDSCTFTIAAAGFSSNLDYIASSFYSRYGIVLNVWNSGTLYFTHQALTKILPVWWEMYNDYDIPECMKYKFGFNISLDKLTTKIKNRPSCTRRWSREELKILKDNCSSMDGSEIMKLLPNRTIVSIHTKLHKLGLKLNAGWSDEELKLLKDNYKEMTIKELTTILPNRTYFAIRSKLHDLGLKKKLIWTDEELKILEDNYQDMTNRELTSILPNRTMVAIRYKLKTLGWKRN